MNETQIEEGSIDEFAVLSALKRDLLWSLAHENYRTRSSLRSELGAYRNEELDHGLIRRELDDLIDRGLVSRRERGGRASEYGDRASEHDNQPSEFGLTERARRALSARQAWQENVGRQ